MVILSTTISMMGRVFLLTSIIFGLSAAILFVTLTQLDPLGPQRNIALISLFIALFTGITAFLTFFFFFLSEIFAHKHLGVTTYVHSIRRALLIALCACICIALLIFGILSYLELALLVSFFFLVEIIFITWEKHE